MWIVIGMRGILAAGVIVLFFVQIGSAETSSDGNISISIDVPEYVYQNESFLVNVSAVNTSAYSPVVYRIYLDALLLKRSLMFFYDGEIWNRTIKWTFRGGVGGIEWYLPSYDGYNAGQTIPLKFRAQNVTHTFEFNVTYWPIDCGCHYWTTMIVEDNVTAKPVFDPSVRVTVSSGSAVVFEAIPGKGVDYIRFSEENQQYIVNWDTSGHPSGEYHIRANFSNGYESETAILLHD